MSLKDLNGYLITLEGGEGCGKTVQAKLLKEYLESLGCDVITTREPGGVDLAEKIRHLLLNPEVTQMDAMTEVLLYTAARRELFIDVIQPALHLGKVVICDRFFDSSIVYQGMVKGVGWEKVYDINMAAVENTIPNLTLLLDVSPAIALERIQQNNREKNRFDLSSMDFHVKVRYAYRFLAKKFNDRFEVVDAGGSIEGISEVIKRIVSSKIVL
jgi:dTMP kinase